LIANGISTPVIGLAANGALALGCYWIARCGLNQSRGLDAWLASSVLFWTACTLGLEIQSGMGLISLSAVVVEAALVLGVGALLHWVRGPDDRGTHREPIATGPDLTALLGLALLLSAALMLGMRSLLLAVKVVSDGPIYHLYFSARWWKAGTLMLVAAPFGENAATYFPANGDLWFTWLMASWGSERLAKVGQAPFLALAWLAAYGCARRLGAGRSSSMVASCWFASSTPLLIYSFEPNVDTIFVAGYLVAAYFFLEVARGKGNSATLCLAALAAGLSLGTKPVGVVFVPPLVVVMIGAIVIKPTPARIKIIQVCVAALLPLATCGYWFLRNGLLTGNPLYPMEVRALGRTILSGWYGPEAMRFSHYYIPFREWRALCDILLTVLDPRLAPLWIASLAGGCAAKNRNSSGTRTCVCAFSLMAVLNVALYWICIPYRSQQRFMLQALGLAVVPLAITLDRSAWLLRLATILLALHLLSPQSWPFSMREDAIPWDFTRSIRNVVDAPVPLCARLEQAFSKRASPGSIVSLAVMVSVCLLAVPLVWAWGRLFTRTSGFKRNLTAVTLASALFLFLGVAELWTAGMDPRLRFYPPFLDFYRGWLNFDIWSGPRGSRVAYSGTNLPYYLLGDGLRNQVRYVNVDRHRDWLLHDYHRDAARRGAGNWPNSRPGWDRMAPDFQAWLENLDAENIQLLVVTRVNPNEGVHNVADSDGFPIERSWADTHPNRFHPLYGEKENDPWFRLYRVRR
jgi:hypothetical protein